MTAAPTRKALRARWSRILSELAEIETMSVDDIDAAITEERLRHGRFLAARVTETITAADDRRRRLRLVNDGSGAPS